tara:strand:+ start:279 stop:494 length:216 start_codon:yes stop_codon:yes gene_type:complete
MLHQNSRDLFDELMGKLTEQELQNRGVERTRFVDGFEEYDKILDEMYAKFEYFESEIIKIENGTPVPNRDR